MVIFASQKAHCEALRRTLNVPYSAVCVDLRDKVFNEENLDESKMYREIIDIKKKVGLMKLRIINVIKSKTAIDRMLDEKGLEKYLSKRKKEMAERNNLSRYNI